MKRIAAQDESLTSAQRTTPVDDRGLFPRVACVVAMALGMVWLTGCAGNNTDVVLAGTAENPQAIIVTSPTTPGPNDPLSLFEQRRLLARIQRDPQHQLSRLSPRERRGLAALAAAAQANQPNDDE